MTLTDDRPDAHPAPAAGGGAQPSVADQLGELIAPLFGGALPLRIRAWDGSTAGPTS